MKFGLFYQLPCAPEQSEATRYQRNSRADNPGDEIGFDTAWLAELHFFRPFSIMPAPLIVATAIAQRTRRIRLGTGVSLLPFHHPLRIAAEGRDGRHTERRHGSISASAAAPSRSIFRVSTLSARKAANASRKRSKSSRRPGRNERSRTAASITSSRRSLFCRGQCRSPIRQFASPPTAPKPQPSPVVKGYDMLAASPINPMPGFFDHVERYRAALPKRAIRLNSAMSRGYFSPTRWRLAVRSARAVFALDDALLPAPSGSRRIAATARSTRARTPI